MVQKKDRWCGLFYWAFGYKLSGLFILPANPAKLAIELNETVVETETVKDRKKGYTIIFSARTETNENITFYLRISASGMASLSINSSSRTAITYLGYLKM